MRAVVAFVFLAGCHVLFPLDARDTPPVPDGPPAADAATDGASAPKRVFITDNLYDGNLGGLLGADAECQGAAVLGGLEGTFVAWLSSATASARVRITPFDGPYVLVNGELVANSFGELIGGELMRPIDLTETHQAPPQTSTSCGNGNGVWTNTMSNGFANAPACSDWTTNVSGSSNAGNSTTKDGRWTDDVGCRGIPCTEEMSLYCIEQ